jgi:hypothetical protein
MFNYGLRFDAEQKFHRIIIRRLQRKFVGLSEAW